MCLHKFFRYFLLCSCTVFAAIGSANNSNQNVETLPNTNINDILIQGIKDVIQVGTVYVESTDQLAEKTALYECGTRFLKNFLSKLKNIKEDKNALREYNACIKSTNAGTDLSVKNPQFAGFESSWISYEDEDEYKNRNWAAQFLKKTVIELPHPLALFKKGAEDIGKFAFTNTEDSAQIRFVAIVKEALLLVLDEAKYGEEAYIDRMKAKLRPLQELSKNNTVFQNAERNEAKAEEEIQTAYPSQTLVEIGQKIASILAGSGGLLVLPNQDRLKLGVSVAELLNPTYTNMQKSKKENNNLEIKLGDQINLGDSVIKEVEKIKAPAQLEDDLDAKFFAMTQILSVIYQKRDMQASNTVKKAEFAENNPLVNAFKF